MVLAAGSTGDVEPFAALAGRLAGRGHDVTLAADAGFERLAPGGRVEFAPIRADFRSLLPAPGRNRPSLREEVFPVIRGMLGDSWRVAQSRQPEVIVAHQKSLAAPHLAEKLGIPHVQALTVPMLTPTREFPLPGMFRHDLGGLLNRESYRMTGLLTRPYARLIRGWRSGRLNLAPRGKPPAPAKTLYCYSPSLVPTPADWPPGTVATGYWLREQGDNAQPADPGLERFVAAGAPPVYVGFGSSVGPDPARVGAAVRGAVRQARRPRRDRERVGRAERRARRLRRAGHGERAASLVVPPCCRRRPSRRGGDDRGRPARGTSDRCLPLSGRPVFLGRGCAPRRRWPAAAAGEQAHPFASCVGDPPSPR